MWTFGWFVHQINSSYEVLKLKQSFRKNKLVTGKTPFFAIDTFCTPQTICLTLASDRAVFYGNVVLSILGLSTKKLYSSLLKKVCFF